MPRSKPDENDVSKSNIKPKPKSKPKSKPKTATKQIKTISRPKTIRQIKRVKNGKKNDSDPDNDTDTRYDATLIDKGEFGEEDADNEIWDAAGDDIDDIDDIDDADDPDIDNTDDNGDADDEEDVDVERDVDVDVDIGEEEDCAYNVMRKAKGSKKLGAMIDKEDDDDDEGADFNVDENELNDELYVKPEERRTSKHLALYERVRLLGERTSQLAQGAKPMIKGVDGIDPRTIAQLELESKMIPIMIIRPLPNGKKEKWYIRELKLKKKYIIYGFTNGSVDVDKDVVNRIKDEYQKGGSIIGYSHLADSFDTTATVAVTAPVIINTKGQSKKVRKVVS